MIEVEIEKGGSENGSVQRGCAAVVNGKMMYFGGSYDPMQVCYFWYLNHMYMHKSYVFT